ncbi:MAG: hypothetical protein P1V18_02055 [Candidatus Gracilibacteria bacterium]|nr:hypothetical protein [Candidatus Gracilibacteria bacterium]
MPKPLQAIEEPTLIAYYCRSCEKVVKGKPKSKAKRYSFHCPECDRQCSYGSAKSMIKFLRIKEGSENAEILLQMQKAKIEQQAKKALEEKTKK